MKKALYIIHYSLFILLIITLSFCTTGPQTGSLIGTVNLEGESDHSGIMIGIYEQVILDTTITRINNKYPHIGIKISQHTEFDHRFSTLIKTGETDASGYFEIGNISTGVYNVVAIKDSFGFRYIYNVQINEGDNALSEQCKKESGFAKLRHDKKGKRKNDETPFNLSPLIFNLNRSEADIILYPVTYISSDIDTTTTWETDHHYIIENDIYVSGALTIEPGAVIRIKSGKSINFYGSLKIQGEENNMIWFTSNDGFDEFPDKSDSLEMFNKIDLHCSNLIDGEFSWCKINWSANGINNYYNNLNFHHNVITNGNNGFFSESNGLQYSNVICENIKNKVNYIQNSANFSIYNNIFLKNQFSFIVIHSEGTIENTHFEDNQVGIIPFLNGQDSLWIKYNCFKNNEFSISLIGSYVNIVNNNFYNSYSSIQTEAYYEPPFIYSNPTIKNNNFFTLCTHISIKPEDNHYGWFLSIIGVNQDIVISNNYWEFINSIDQMIIDVNDDEEYNYRVIYNPTNYENNAGIQGE